MSENVGKLRLDDLVLDLKRKLVYRGRQEVELAGLSFRLLESLALESPEAIPRDELIRKVWGKIVVSDDTLRQRVRILRQELGSAHYIENVKGIGYRVVGQVQHAALTPGSWLSRHRKAAWMALALVIVMLVWQFMPEVRHVMAHRFSH